VFEFALASIDFLVDGLITDFDKLRAAAGDGVFARDKVDWLSTGRRFSWSWRLFNLVSSALIRGTSLLADAAAVYLASVSKRATDSCFFNCQLTAPPPVNKMRPVFECWSLINAPTESGKSRILFPLLIVLLLLLLLMPLSTAV
jgi:hypothetical protein